MARLYKNGRYAPEKIDCEGWDFDTAGDRNTSDFIMDDMYQDNTDMLGYINDCARDDGAKLSFAESAKVAELTLLKQLVEGVYEVVEMLQDLRDVTILQNRTTKGDNNG